MNHTLSWRRAWRALCTRAGLAPGLALGLMPGLALGMLLGLGGCSDTAAQKQRAEAAALTSMGEKYVREKIRDPAAAQFRNQFIGKGGAPCGEVNAKDAFGAYLGYQRYISVARELTMLAHDMAPDEFEESWREMCR